MVGAGRAFGGRFHVIPRRTLFQPARAHPESSGGCRICNPGLRSGADVRRQLSALLSGRGRDRRSGGAGVGTYHGAADSGPEETAGHRPRHAPAGAYGAVPHRTPPGAGDALFLDKNSGALERRAAGSSAALLLLDLGIRVDLSHGASGSRPADGGLFSPRLALRPDGESRNRAAALGRRAARVSCDLHKLALAGRYRGDFSTLVATNRGSACRLGAKLENSRSTAVAGDRFRRGAVATGDPCERIAGLALERNGGPFCPCLRSSSGIRFRPNWRPAAWNSR